MIEAFTRLDSEILAHENLSPGSRLTTAEAWVEHLEVNKAIFPGFSTPANFPSLSLQNMQLTIDDMMVDKPTLDVISEIDESILEDDKAPPSAVERERNDIIKVKKVCKCSLNWFSLSCQN